MKKTISAIIILLLFLIPALGSSSYLIRLKNGRQLSTPAYWFEGDKIYFYCVGGVAGMERKEIDKIEKLKTENGEYTVRNPVTATKKELPSPTPVAEKAKEPEKRLAEAEQKAEKSLSPQKPHEKIDLKPYQDKMAELTADLNKTLARLREAIKNKNLEEQDKARADNRRISAERRMLTKELKEKNNGELPADWWAGAGK